MVKNQRWFWGAGLVALVSATALGQAATKLYVNGNLVSSNVKMVNGVPYVPLADLAKGQGMQLTKRADGYSLMPQGGANQMAGKFNGKIGEKLFTGKYVLIVRSVETVPVYKGKYRNLYGDVEGGATNDVIVINCTVSNGVKTPLELVIDEWTWEPKGFSMHNALADMSGKSYAVTKYDVNYSETAPGGVKLLPGASADFALVFKVPKDTKPKDLVFSFLDYARRTDDPPVDVRVSLQP